MGILDPRMMYRAGFARGHKGRNTEVEARLARQERLVNFAYEVVGNVAGNSGSTAPVFSFKSVRFVLSVDTTPEASDAIFSSAVVSILSTFLAIVLNNSFAPGKLGVVISAILTSSKHVR